MSVNGEPIEESLKHLQRSLSQARDAIDYSTCNIHAPPDRFCTSRAHARVAAEQNSPRVCQPHALSAPPHRSGRTLESNELEPGGEV